MDHAATIRSDYATWVRDDVMHTRLRQLGLPLDGSRRGRVSTATGN